ncbi:MAG: alpha-E domain-containing protein [Verrucomicrobia bacterium]|nr:MAG: alpha-E domain-containing protein [Verrucomicrobiota bacterium]
MLSRVANTFYWMVRYVERADNLARLVDVNQHLLLDFESLDSERLRDFWQPIISSTGDEEVFHEIYQNAGSHEVIHFLTDDPNNPNSIRSCIALARENARTVRDQLSDELWEELNSLYLFSQSDEAERLIVENPSRYYEAIRTGVMTFHGIASSTIARNEAWEFMDLGRHLERADKTTRFLDISSYLAKPSNGHGSMHQEESLHWTAILRSCSAMGAMRQKKNEANARNAIDLLIFDRDFPRSVRYCVERVDLCLHMISGSPRGSFANEAERESGKLFADLNYGSTRDVFSIGLHAFLDDLQARFNTIGEQVFESFVLMPERLQDKPVLTPQPLSAAAAWQQAQQQQ